MIDPKMIEVIDEWADSPTTWNKTITIDDATLSDRKDLAQRLHDAGFRRVPDHLATTLDLRGILDDVQETSRMVQRDFNGMTGMYWDEWVVNLEASFGDDLATIQNAGQVGGEAIEPTTRDYEQGFKQKYADYPASSFVHQVEKDLGGKLKQKYMYMVTGFYVGWMTAMCTTQLHTAPQPVDMVNVQINRTWFKIKPDPKTGAEIRKWMNLDGDHDLFVMGIGAGSRDTKINDPDPVHFHDGMRLFTAPRHINNSSTQPQPVHGVPSDIGETILSIIQPLTWNKTPYSSIEARDRIMALLNRQEGR